MYICSIKPTRVIDGDSFEAKLIPKKEMSEIIQVRVADIDTPEEDEQGFACAKSFTRDWLAARMLDDLVVYIKKKDSFGRYVSYVKALKSKSDSCLGSALLELKLATVYSRTRRKNRSKKELKKL